MFIACRRYESTPISKNRYPQLWAAFLFLHDFVSDLGVYSEKESQDIKYENK